MTKLTVLFFMFGVVYADARHIHPHEDSRDKLHVEEIWRNEVAKAQETAPAIEDYVNMEVLEEIPHNIKPNRFVPLNNALFFIGHKPCAEEGFKRDYMGICREVWD